MATMKRCGTCELLVRSSYPGLVTWGRCPHREGWVRVHDEPCERHQGEPRGALVRVAVAANLAVAALGAATAVAIDVRYGTALTHVLLAAGALVVAAFARLVRSRELCTEDAKYELLENEDPPPEEEREPPI
jgi:hypothetical protein